MRDFTGIAFAIGFAILVAVAAVVLQPLLRRLKILEDRPVKDDPVPPSQSRPKCVAKGCKKDAECHPYKWVRDDGVTDLWRRMHGAPAILRIMRDEKAEKSTCETHDPMAYAKFVKHHAQDVADDADHKSRLERRRARFETVGWLEELNADIVEHNREFMPSGSNVVPLVSVETETGTESK